MVAGDAEDAGDIRQRTVVTEMPGVVAEMPDDAIADAKRGRTSATFGVILYLMDVAWPKKRAESSPWMRRRIFISDA